LLPFLNQIAASNSGQGDSKRRVAVIGSGIAGLSAAWALSGQAQVTLFEANDYFGGHTHTVDIELEGQRHGVDTGFLVFNERTYPLLIELFKQLDVAVAPSEMSFSVQVAEQQLEWSGSNLNGLFAQRANLFRPAFWGMLAELQKFNRLCTELATRGQEAALAQPIGDFLLQHGFKSAFRDWYLLPMVACIWSCPTRQMLEFPISTLIRFCHNHGLLQITNRPQWYTVRGGAQRYVDKLLSRIPDPRLSCPVQKVRRLAGGGVEIQSARGLETFDAVVMAGHSDQSLRMLDHPSQAERQVLAAIPYQRNRAVLHTDDRLMPRHKRAWAAWNYEHGGKQAGPEQREVCLHYWLNRLQPLPWLQAVMVSLNPVREPAQSKTLAEYDYAHPVFDRGAVAAQARLPLIQGEGQVWYCGAWTRYGFHEDGLLSGLTVAKQLLERWAQQAPGHLSST
jgi:predicted NAD/FAD-binding protein